MRQLIFQDRRRQFCLAVSNRFLAMRPFLTAVMVSAVSIAIQDAAADSKDESTYAKSDLLIEASELKKLPTRPGTRLVLDVRTPEKYQELHFKDAIPVIIADWSKDFGDGRDTELWSRRFGQLGIGRDTEVILYDDRAGQDAARAWWYLRYWGVCQARIVNGGWKAIQAGGLPTISGDARLATATTFSSPPVAARRIELSALVAAHQSGRLGTNHADSLQLIDTRSEKEFLGEQVTEGLRPGTIPGARHLE